MSKCLIVGNLMRRISSYFQVMKEKKEAHRRYRESLEAEERNRNNAAAFSPGIDESTFVFVEGAEAASLTAKSTNLGSGDVGTRKPANSKCFDYIFLHRSR